MTPIQMRRIQELAARITQAAQNETAKAVENQGYTSLECMAAIALFPSAATASFAEMGMPLPVITREG